MEASEAATQSFNLSCSAAPFSSRAYDEGQAQSCPPQSPAKRPSRLPPRRAGCSLLSGRCQVLRTRKQYESRPGHQLQVFVTAASDAIENLIAENNARKWSTPGSRSGDLMA